MLPVFLDCPFCIGPSVFSNIYLSVVDVVPCQQRLKIEIEKCSDHSKRSKLIPIIYVYEYVWVNVS